MSPRRKKAYLYLLLVEIIWGLAGPVIKYTLGGIDPLPFIIYRLFLSSVISVIFFTYKIRGGKKFIQLRAHFLLALLYGILSVTLGLGILFIAMDKTTVLDLTLVGILGPLLSLTGGHIFFKDHLTRREKFGIAIVILGVLLNSFWPIVSGESKIFLTGNILLLIYLIADSGSVLLAKRSLKYKIKSSNLTNLSFIVGFLTLLPLGLRNYGISGLTNIIFSLPLNYHLGVWFMAFLSGNLAYYLFIRGERTLKVTETVLFHYLQPVIMIPLAVFWLHETLSIHYIAGAVIITIGLFIVEFKRYNKKTSGP